MAEKYFNNSPGATVGQPLSTILLVTPDFPPKTGGISTYLATIFSDLLRRKVVVVAPQHQGSFLPPTPSNLRVVRSRSWPLIRRSILLSLLLSSIRVAGREHVQIVHCGHPYVSFVGYLLKRLFGIPSATWVHGMELFHPRMMRFLKFFLLASDLVVVNSSYTADLVIKMGVSRKRVKVIHPPVDLRRFDPSLDPAPVVRKHKIEGKKVILTVGRLAAAEQYKGQDQVIKALPQIAEKVRQVVYLIVGEGDDKPRLERLTLGCGVQEKVIFAGSVSEELLPRYYAACDLFVMTSRVRRDDFTMKMEGFGIVFLEAAACGKPSIGGRSGGIPDAIVDGVTGLLVDPEDPRAIADAVVRLLTDGELARKMGEAGRRRALREFTPEKAARAVESLIEEVIRRTAGSYMRGNPKSPSILRSRDRWANKYQ